MITRRRFLKGAIASAAAFIIPTSLLKNVYAERSQIPLFGKATLNNVSSLDRVSARQLLIVIEKKITEILEWHKYSLNDKITRSIIQNKSSNFLESIKQRRGLDEFRVVCDKTNNSPKIIDKNQLFLDVYVKLNSSAEYHKIRFISQKGIKISELLREK